METCSRVYTFSVSLMTRRAWSDLLDYLLVLWMLLIAARHDIAVGSGAFAIVLTIESCVRRLRPVSSDGADS